MKFVKQNVLEKGYRPENALNTNTPPKGGSAVPSFPSVKNNGQQIQREPGGVKNSK